MAKSKKKNKKAKAKAKRKRKENRVFDKKLVENKTQIPEDNKIKKQLRKLKAGIKIQL